MIQALFRVLLGEDEGLQAKEAVARTEQRLTLTEFERATFPNNPDVVRFPKILRFTTINAVKAGWLRKRSGVWTLTEDGRAALQQFPDAEELSGSRGVFTGSGKLSSLPRRMPWPRSRQRRKPVS